ncbi:hypothetical protein EON79_17115 [bacterium]|nr:MAG: hypothetical protein EON79_17115 [bacterium]
MAARSGSNLYVSLLILSALLLAPIEVSDYATGLEVVWDIEPVSASRTYVLERPGRVRLIEGGKLQAAAYANLPVGTGGQGGLFDLESSPDYAKSGIVYITHTVKGEGGHWLRLAKFKDTGTGLEDTGTIFTGPKSTDPAHFGGRMAFGPGGKLFLSLGERHEKEKAAQDGVPYGKTIAIDPATKEWSVHTKGHRNPQGIAYDPASKVLAVSEHGPTNYDAPRGYDEVNILRPGADYGWPRVWGDKTLAGTRVADKFWVEATAPGGLDFYKGDLLVPMLASKALWRVDLQDGKVTGSSRITGIDAGRLRSVATLPDGSVLVGTSNGERGRKVDKVLRITGL